MSRRHDGPPPSAAGIWSIARATTKATWSMPCRRASAGWKPSWRTPGAHPLRLVAARCARRVRRPDCGTAPVRAARARAVAASLGGRSAGNRPCGGRGRRRLPAGRRVGHRSGARGLAGRRQRRGPRTRAQHRSEGSVRHGRSPRRGCRGRPSGPSRRSVVTASGRSTVRLPTCNAADADPRG